MDRAELLANWGKEAHLCGQGTYMFGKLEGVEERFVKVEKLLSDPDLVKDQEAYRNCAKEHAELGRIVSAYREYKQVAKDIEETKELLKDGDEDRASERR
jgi:peptide chain release factor 1